MILIIHPEKLLRKCLVELLLSCKFLACHRFNTFISTVVNTNVFILDDAITVHLQEIAFIRQKVDGLKRLRNGACLNCTIADLRAAMAPYISCPPTRALKIFGMG
jgi:hypothetical protein